MRAWTLAVLVLGMAGCSDGGGDGSATDDTEDTTAEDTLADLPPPAEPKAYTGGECPSLAGEVTNFNTGSSKRKFIVNLPADPAGAGVLFLWHGNGDSAANFDRYMDGPGLADDLNVITVVPDAGAGGFGLDWSVPPNNTAGDAKLFDDILSCLDSEYGVDRRRVYTAGFSAGALWSSWLVMNRAEHLASAVIFSGGSDGMGGSVNGYSTPAWDIPIVMTEGGPTDEVIVNFQQMTDAMSGKMRDDGSTVVVCSHNEGHTPPSNFKRWAWDFLDAHVFGMSPSPYADGADPSGKLPGGCAWE